VKKYGHTVFAILFIAIPYIIQENKNLLIASTLVLVALVPDMDWWFKKHRWIWFHSGFFGLLAFTYTLYWSPQTRTDWIFCEYYLLALASHLWGDVPNKKTIIGFSLKQSRHILFWSGAGLIVLAILSYAFTL